MSAFPRQAFIAAGANLGDRSAALAGAAERLRATAGISVVELSTIRETEPVGVIDQPKFLNMVLGVETSLSPEELLAVQLEIEREHGRVRRRRWGPRTLDLDLLVYEGETRNSPSLQLPHPRMFEREFVLAPLRELLVRPRFMKPCWAALRDQVAVH